MSIKPSQKQLDTMKSTFAKRSRAIGFVAIFITIYVILLFFSNARWFTPIAGHQKVQFVLNFLNMLMVVVLIYFVAKEVTQLCFPGRKREFIYTVIALFVQTVGCTLFLLLTRYEIVDISWQTKRFNPWDLYLIISLSGVVFFTIVSTLVWVILARKTVYIQKKVKFWYPFLMLTLTSFFVGFLYVSIIHTWTTFFFLCLLSIGCDAFAYIGGTLFGKHKMAPHISPKKSWEGIIFGLFVTLAIFVGIVCLFYFIPKAETFNETYTLFCFLGVQTCEPICNLKPYFWAIYIGAALLIMVVSTCGDLFFSFIKRRFDIKDFSNLLPGHGGILDRLDAIIFTFGFYFIVTIVLQLILLGTKGSTQGLQFLWGSSINW